MRKAVKSVAAHATHSFPRSAWECRLRRSAARRMPSRDRGAVQTAFPRRAWERVYSGFRMGCTRSWIVLIHGQVLFTLVPTLRVGMPSPTLRVVFPRAAPFGWRGHSRVAAPARQREVPTAPLRWRQAPREFGRAPKTTRSVGDGIPTRSVGTSVICLHHWKPGGVCHPSVNRCKHRFGPMSRIFSNAQDGFRGGGPADSL